MSGCGGRFFGSKSCVAVCFSLLIRPVICQCTVWTRERERDRETERDRQTERQRQRERHRERDRQRDRERHRERDTHRKKEREREREREHTCLFNCHCKSL